MDTTSKSLLAILTIGLAIAGSASYAVPSVSAASTTPTFLLGVTDPLDPLGVKLQSLTSSLTILPTVSDLALVGGSSILIVDGAWLGYASSLDPTVVAILLGKVLQGVPTVVVRGNPTLLGDSLSGLMRLSAPGITPIAEGLGITGTLEDGTRQGQTFLVLSGFDYAVESEFAWAERQTTQGTASAISSSPVTVLKSSRPQSTLDETSDLPPQWESLVNMTLSTGDRFQPYGRLTSTFSPFRLKNSGSTSYRWYNMFMELTIEPGISLYNSQFRTSDETDIIRANQESSLLVDHGPSLFSTEGPDTLSYSIGVTATVDGAAVTASQAMSYFLKHTMVTDISQSTVVGWVHDIDSRTDAGRLPFTIIPGWTVRVDNGETMVLQGEFTSRFDRLQGNNIVETASGTLQLTVQG